MPHVFDIDGINNDLFILMHLSKGSGGVCDELAIKYTNECYDQITEYRGLLKMYVSQIMVNAAIKLRLMSGVGIKADPDFRIDDLDARACDGLKIGNIVEGKFKLNLRQSCNKLVHATDTRMVWNAEYDEDKIERWTGKYILLGNYGKDDWELELNVFNWCVAMRNLNDILQEEIDWHHIWKWDE